MSIADQITRLQTAKSKIKTAIENKGVTVGDGTIDTYASFISQITTGGGGSDLPSSIAEIQSGSFTVASDTAEGQNITLTMSEAPTNILVWAENDVQETYTQLFYMYGASNILGFIGNSSNQISIHHGTSATSYGIGLRSASNGGFIDVTKDGFTINGFATGVYYFRSATAYHWLAWR